MKTIPIATIIIGIALTIGCAEHSIAQSTTAGKSGGSTASTGAGYRTPGQRPTTSETASMTIADEGASRGYMYVPPGQRKTGLKKKKNAATSPDGSDSSTMPATKNIGTNGSKKQHPHQ